MRASRVLVALALSSSACGDPLVSVERIASLRALGARVEIDGDAGRAAPFPGESAAVRFFVAAPELTPSFGYGLVVCEAVPGDVNPPTCAGEPFASTYTEPASAAPELTFSVPEGIAADARVAVLGVLCEGEAPRTDSVPPACGDESVEHRVSLAIGLPGDSEPNRNPAFSDDAISFDGEPLVAAMPVEGPCADLGFLELAAGSKHTFSVALTEDDRDPLPAHDGVGPSRESLQVSHFSTGGELDRAFSYVSGDDGELSVDVDWKAPGRAEDGGQLVRFFFVVRDLRGGSAFTERALCVLP